MYARILRIELRRSTALLAAFLVAAVGVLVLYTSNPPYLSWMGLVVAQRDIMQLIWPVGLGLGAWQALRERRSRIGELVASTARPRWLRVPPMLAAMALAPLAGYLVMLAGAGGHVRYVDSYFPVGAVPVIAIGALSLVAAVWLGLAVGNLLPSPLTPPLLVVVGFAGMAILPPVLLPGGEHRAGTALLVPILQAPGGAAVEVMTVSLRANLSQALWLAALAATGVVLFAAGRRPTRAAAVLPVVLGAAIAIPAMPRQLAQAWVPDRHAVATVCSGTAPTLCIARVHAHLLGELRAPARDAVAILAGRLPSAPTRVMLYTVDKAGPPAGPRRSDTVVASPSWDEVGQLSSRRQLVFDLLVGAGTWPCPNVNGNGKNDARFELRYIAARYAVANGLLGAGQISIPNMKVDGAVGPLIEQAAEALAALPPDEQRARVTAYRAAELDCTGGDRLDILVGPGRIR